DAGRVEETARAWGAVVAMTGVLGINPAAPEWATAGGASEDALARLVETLLEERATARSAKDFTTADRVRDQLAAAGIAVEDGPDGAHWSIG
ncbi:MAG: cysteine--tRNA ligase, partial [Aeromicrobium sp.]